MEKGQCSGGSGRSGNFNTWIDHRVVNKSITTATMAMVMTIITMVAAMYGGHGVGIEN